MCIKSGDLLPSDKPKVQSQDCERDDTRILFENVPLGGCFSFQSEASPSMTDVYMRLNGKGADYEKMVEALVQSDWGRPSVKVLCNAHTTETGIMTSTDCWAVRLLDGLLVRFAPYVEVTAFPNWLDKRGRLQLCDEPKEGH